MLTRQVMSHQCWVINTCQSLCSRASARATCGLLQRKLGVGGIGKLKHRPYHDCMNFECLGVHSARKTATHLTTVLANFEDDRLSANVAPDGKGLTRVISTFYPNIGSWVPWPEMTGALAPLHSPSYRSRWRSLTFAACCMCFICSAALKQATDSTSLS